MTCCQDIAIMMYKVKYKLLPSYVVDIFEENEARFQSVRYGKHSLRYQGP